ncbi:ImuA family protein [Azospirillum doebereinerae]
MPEPTPVPLSGDAEHIGRMADRTAVLAGLRARIRRIEGVGGEGARVLPLGVAAIDAALPDGGLPLGCLHALTGEGSGAGTAFAAALLAKLATARAPVLWILRGRDLHAAGLAAYGLTPDRLIAVRAERRGDALWAMEEALRCSALSAVLGEVDRVDLTGSRRLQLAAESTGVTGFLLRTEEGGSGGRRSGGEAASVAVTRWRVAPAPGQSGEEPGVGAPRWRVELERCRGGRPGAWILDWEEDGWRDETPGAAQPPGRLERVA